MADSLDTFNAVFPMLADDLRSLCCEQYRLPEQVWKWLEKSLVHNALGGKCNRGLSVVDTTQLILDRDLTSDEYFQTATLGWMVEFLQAMMLVVDDIMDHSKTRRGRPCWYLVPGVGMQAANDAPMLESAIYVLLKKYFKCHRAYVDMVELFHEVSFQVELGQTFDMLAAPQDGKVDLDSFSMERYNSIVTYKTAYYTFYLPVALALFYTGRASPRNLKQAEEVLLGMGTYFQVQDDYLDNFADPSVLGKIGTDIQDNKCSRLVIMALERCTAGQRTVLEANYGKKEAACVRKVKELYNELGLQAAYLEYEENEVRELERIIDGIDETEGLRKTIFRVFLSKIHKRSK
ncbi:hypothetical protein VPNG_02622 [Cytospora leucostoma]|uniref:Uncharacterized protein n=1 Tax=Cytospora leucostoma TaxID=1230097 RepID=A0A423XI10_9PEZI|nr:hypothetical protein VPNG_02622 [Cytospora leucostoma]